MTESHGYCHLRAVLGTVESCPGGACAFWDPTSDSCVFHGVERELDGRPWLAAHLLELRAALEHPREDPHSRFAHLLNDEQEAEAR